MKKYLFIAIMLILMSFSAYALNCGSPLGLPDQYYCATGADMIQMCDGLTGEWFDSVSCEGECNGEVGDDWTDVCTEDTSCISPRTGERVDEGNYYCNSNTGLIYVCDTGNWQYNAACSGTCISGISTAKTDVCNLADCIVDSDCPPMLDPNIGSFKCTSGKCEFVPKPFDWLPVIMSVGIISGATLLIYIVWKLQKSK